jgi:hypothetical protein
METSGQITFQTDGGNIEIIIDTSTMAGSGVTNNSTNIDNFKYI